MVRGLSITGTLLHAGDWGGGHITVTVHALGLQFKEEAMRMTGGRDTYMYSNTQCTGQHSDWITGVGMMLYI